MENWFTEYGSEKDLCRENTVFFTGNICVFQVGIYLQTALFRDVPIQVHHLGLQSLVGIADHQLLGGVLLMETGGQKVVHPV